MIDDNEKSDLPHIDLPTHEFIVPSSGKTIIVRPFTVREEKLLLIAAESGKSDDIINTTKQIINNCIVKGDFNIEKVPFFDIDFLFTFLRSKAIGGSVELTITCKNKVDEVTCGNRFSAFINLDNVELVNHPDLSDKVEFGKEKGVKMKYPTYAVTKAIDGAKSIIDKKTALIGSCIEYIYDGKKMYNAKEYSPRQMSKFIEDLTQENYKKLEEWVDGFPTMVAKVNAVCPKCKYEHKLRYSDFEDFFF